MKSLLVLAASALALAACAPNSKATQRASLDCPGREGRLTRTGVSSDGKTCLYRTEAGDEVSLQLVATHGDPQAALAGVERQLNAEVAAAAAALPAAQAAKAADGAAAAQASVDDARRSAEQARADAEKAAATASEDGDGDGDVDIHIGDHGRVVAHGGDDTAEVHLPGIHINADHDNAKIRIAGVSIDASDGEATVRMNRDVRLRGEAFSRQKRGVRATYIRAGEDLPGGFRAVGYEAGGPKAGPLAVAVVRAKGADRESQVYNDVKRLVRRNGGV